MVQFSIVFGTKSVDAAGEPNHGIRAIVKFDARVAFMFFVGLALAS